MRIFVPSILLDSFWYQSAPQRRSMRLNLVVLIVIGFTLIMTA